MSKGSDQSNKPFRPVGRLVGEELMRSLQRQLAEYQSMHSLKQVFLAEASRAAKKKKKKA